MEEIPEYDKYINAVLSKPSDLQRKIFYHWSRLRLEEDPKGGDPYLFKKSLNCFFPYRFFLHFPFELPDMEAAVNIIQSALTKENDKPKILFYSDRDADGITSMSICYLFFTQLLNYPLSQIEIITPLENDRYGVTEEIVEKISASAPDILIVLDSGSSNKDSFAELNKRLPGLQTIVFDHHFLPEKTEDYPKVSAFVNPMRLPANHVKQNLCTAGLAYMFIWALTYSLTSDYKKVYKLDQGVTELYIQNGVLVDPEHIPIEEENLTVLYAGNDTDSRVAKDEFILERMWEKELRLNPDLVRVNRFFLKTGQSVDSFEKFIILKNLALKKSYEAISFLLPLAAIGTVADSMKLTDENRILVSEGLRVMQSMAAKIPLGLKQLFTVMKIHRGSMTEKDISFGLAPAINAAGRMGNAALALQALIESDPLAAAKAASALKDENEKRKQLSEEAVEILESQINAESLPPALVLYDERVHRGISGLVASKFAEKYGRPALVIVNDGDCLRGSIRASNGENVISIIHKLEKWFIQSGGHIGAAGFSLEYDKKDKFIKEFNRVVREEYENIALEAPSTIPDNLCIIELKDTDITPSLWNEIKIFAPFGDSNPAPVLLLEVTEAPEFKYMGKDKKHLKLTFPAIGTSMVEGVWFFGASNKEAFEKYENYLFAAEPNINFFFGKTKYQLRFSQSILKNTA